MKAKISAHKTCTTLVVVIPLFEVCVRISLDVLLCMGSEGKIPPLLLPTVFWYYIKRFKPELNANYKCQVLPVWVSALSMKS